MAAQEVLRLGYSHQGGASRGLVEEEAAVESHPVCGLALVVVEVVVGNHPVCGLALAVEVAAGILLALVAVVGVEIPLAYCLALALVEAEVVEIPLVCCLALEAAGSHLADFLALALPLVADMGPQAAYLELARWQLHCPAQAQVFAGHLHIVLH